MTKAGHSLAFARARAANARTSSPDNESALSRVNNDEIIAQPVHFGKGDGACLTHAAYIGGSAAKRHIAVVANARLDLASRPAYFAATSEQKRNLNWFQPVWGEIATRQQDLPTGAILVEGSCLTR